MFVSNIWMQKNVAILLYFSNLEMFVSNIWLQTCSYPFVFFQFGNVCFQHVAVKM